jgi:hypothetical protein
MSIPFRRTIPILAMLIVALPALAQEHGKPLDLRLSPDSVPAGAATSAPAHSSSVATQTPPGVYYGDTSGRIYSERRSESTPCDEDRFARTQVHGSVGAGVMAGDHISGTSQSATVHISKAFGSCNHPTGGVSISIGVRRDDVHPHGGP